MIACAFASTLKPIQKTGAIPLATPTALTGTSDITFKTLRITSSSYRYLFWLFLDIGFHISRLQIFHSFLTLNTSLFIQTPHTGAAITTLISRLQAVTVTTIKTCSDNYSFRQWVLRQEQRTFLACMGNDLDADVDVEFCGQATTEVSFWLVTAGMQSKNATK